MALYGNRAAPTPREAAEVILEQAQRMAGRADLGRTGGIGAHEDVAQLEGGEL